MPLTDLEQKLLAQVKAHPYATQKELGDALGISRASVANYIERLQNKGLILGRAYILSEKSGIVCVGGAVLDRVLRLSQKAILHTSQPANSHETRGGVCRNVAENLARLGESVKLISVVGGDDTGRKIISETESAGVDVSLIDRMPEHVTGTYTAIMQPDGELHLGVADMEIFGALDTDLLDKYKQHIISADLVFTETNCTEALLQSLIERCKQSDLPLAVDAVSIPKFHRLPDDLCGVTYLFCNLDEARAITNKQAPEETAKSLHQRGAEHIIITNGADDVFVFANGEFLSVQPHPVEVTDVSGAGDAFVAGTLHALLQKQPLIDAAKSGIVAASLTVQSTFRNSPDLSAHALMAGAKEINIKGH